MIHRSTNRGVICVWAAGAAALVGLLATPGCEVQINPDLANATPTLQFDEFTTVVKLVNATSAALRAELYASTEPMSHLPGNLFTAGNLVTAGIGVGGTGVVGPGLADYVTLECSGTLALGTPGGVFLDPETGEELGNGTQQYVRSTLTLCGRLITITYFEVDDGYETIIDID